MKQTFFIIPLILTNIFKLLSQDGIFYPEPVIVNNSNNPCITVQEYALIEKQIADNNKLLGIKHPDNILTTTFNWPLQVANGLKDCGYYLIVNYVDQDLSSGLQDYNCGSATYDGHTGDDIVIEPYPFYKMDNEQVDVIAAAPGTIISKSDGNFDKNCSRNNLTANYIIIQHKDGSEALYWHMKKNTLTSKTVGQTVIAGEFLGKVGSSGSSTLPHLHFEVWAGTTLSTRQEAFSGPCNLLNKFSWWTNQKPYKDPKPIKVQVNNIAPVLPNCPDTETPNEDSCFIAPGTAKFYVWIRDDTIGRTINMRIINPDNTTFLSWSYKTVTTYNLAAYNFTRGLPINPGTYKFVAVYNGDSCIQSFKVNCNIVSVNEGNVENMNLIISPNPVLGELFLQSDVMLLDARIYIQNIFGQTTKAIKNINGKSATISLDHLDGGLYFISLIQDNKLVKRQKIIVMKN